MHDKTKVILITGPSLIVLASTVLVILWRTFLGENSITALLHVGHSIGDIAGDFLPYYLFATFSGVSFALILFRHALGRWLTVILFAFEAALWLYFTVIPIITSRGLWNWYGDPDPIVDLPIAEAVFYDLHSLLGLLLIVPLSTSAAVRAYFRKPPLERRP